MLNFEAGQKLKIFKIEAKEWKGIEFVNGFGSSSYPQNGEWKYCSWQLEFTGEKTKEKAKRLVKGDIIVLIRSKMNEQEKNEEGKKKSYYKIKISEFLIADKDDVSVSEGEETVEESTEEPTEEAAE